MTAEHRIGAIVLAGGESRRMGRPKAALLFGAETWLARAVRIVGAALDPVVVVGARNQSLPNLPAGIEILRDQCDRTGPLEGLRVGLEHLQQRGCDGAFLCACDMPLLTSAFVNRVVALSTGHEIAIPVLSAAPQPLAAVYATRLVAKILQLQDRGSAGPMDLLKLCSARRITEQELIDVDPALQCCRSFDTPEQLDELLRSPQPPG